MSTKKTKIPAGTVVLFPDGRTTSVKGGEYVLPPGTDYTPEAEDQPEPQPKPRATKRVTKD